MSTVTHWGFGLARLLAAAILSGVVMGGVVVLSIILAMNWGM